MQTLLLRTPLYYIMKTNSYIPEGLREKGVQNGIYAGVAVCEDLRDDLEADEHGRGAVHLERPQQQDDVDGEPGEREENDDDQHHLDHALLVAHALRGDAAAGSLNGGAC